MDDIKILTFAELAAECDAARAAIRAGDAAVGRWRVDAKLKVVRHSEARWFEVDLDEVHCEADALEQVVRVSRKTAFTPADAGDLLRLFDRLGFIHRGRGRAGR